MVTLEQVKLLESKISRAIDFVGQVTEENIRLKKRNEELGDTIAKLQEEKVKVEEGIVSALGKLNQFEDAIERSLSAVKGPAAAAHAPAKPAPVPAAPTAPAPAAVAPAATAPAQTSPAPAAAQPRPAVPSAYMVDEEEADVEDTSAEDDTGEAELDIF
jgi:hypothetical protein